MDTSDARRRRAIELDLVGGQDAQVEIVKHDLGWSRRFAEEADRLRRLVPGLQPNHIGSTAVLGLPAKPVIDIMALVADLDEPLATLTDSGGYAYPAEYNATLERRRWLCRPSAACRTHHVHLVDDPAILARHIAFRDALRASSELAARYAVIKCRLAGAHPHDRDAYTQAKGDFITEALRSPPGSG